MLENFQEADAIFLEELRSGGLYETTSQAFAVLLPVKSVGVEASRHDRVGVRFSVAIAPRLRISYL